LTLPFVVIPFWFLPLLGYGCVTAVCSLHLALQQRQPHFLLLLPALFPLLHIFNGLGLLAGFLLPGKGQVCYKDQPVTVRRLHPESDPAKPGVIRWI